MLNACEANAQIHHVQIVLGCHKLRVY